MKNFKQLAGIFLMSLFSISLSAQDLPQPSPAASFTQRVGVTDISMDYSRPGVKGRKIWGELVPFDQVWRAGANASTKIEFSTDVMIEGKTVKAGKYALYVIPAEAEWTFIISSYVDGWGVDKYTDESDIVRVKANTANSPMTENMLFSVDQIKNNSAVLSLSWEEVTVGFTIEMNTVELSQGILEDAVKKADDSFRTYNNAAKFYLENGESAKGLEMALKSTSQDKRFWNVTVLSEAYFATGDSKMAVKTAKEALTLSEEAKYQPYVNRNKKNLEEWGKKK